jgi:hypothetical protein
MTRSAAKGRLKAKATTKAAAKDTGADDRFGEAAVLRRRDGRSHPGAAFLSGLIVYASHTRCVFLPESMENDVM